MEVVFSKSTTTMSLPNGLFVTLHRGEPWPADDPFVVSHRDLFSDTPVVVNSSRGHVEVATAAPGEKRKSGR